MALLVAINGDAFGEQHTIRNARTVMGRHPDCEIVLDAAAVSRQHAQIVQESDVYYVEDLHSRNGTFVNGELINGRRALEDGDRIKICDLNFAFFLKELPSRGNQQTLAAGSTSLAMMVDDDDQALGSSTIMSKLGVTSSRSPSRLTVNPEVKLRAMVEIATNLGKVVAVDEVLPKILDSLFKIYSQADRGFVILKAPDGRLLPKAIKHRRENHEDQVRISRTIINQVMTSKEAILSADAANDSRFQQSESIADLRIRSVMCAPLVDSEGNSLGVIQVDTMDQRQRFQKDDLDLLASIASQSAIAIDNAQLHENALRQHALQRDLELAHKVQRGLLPASPPRVQGYQFFDYYEAALQVGGDYYDYIELPGGRVAVVLADVTGKGVSAALLMAKLSGEVRFCLASEHRPATALCHINASFCRSGWDDRFVTFVLAVIDPAKNEVTVVNAGHMPPLVRNASGTVEEIGADEAGVPLGVDTDFPYEQSVRRLMPGELVTMFTDGISEAMNSTGELYGLTRLRAQVGAPFTSAAVLGRKILDDVKNFASGHPQSDDMCIACFGRSAV